MFMAKTWQKRGNFFMEKIRIKVSKKFHLVKITNGSMKRNKNNDAKWKIMLNISSKCRKLTTFKKLDLLPFGGRLINHYTPSETRKLKRPRSICVLPSLHFLKLETTPKTKLKISIWKNPPFFDSNKSFQPCQMLNLLGFIQYANFSENATYRYHGYLV